MTTIPTTLAMIATSLTATTLMAASSADIDNNGDVNAMDLLSITSFLGQACDSDCAADLNNDGVVNTADIMELMQQWGPVADYVAPVTEPAPETEPEESVTRDPNRDMSWQGQDPILMDAIYYDDLSRSQQRRNLATELNQGSQTRAWAAGNDITVLPISINGAVDYYEDGVIDQDDKDKFLAWMDANVPADYAGPICLDLEGSWWPILDSSNQSVVDTAIDFYIEGLEYAQSLRPNAKIGYWGIPKKSHSKENSTTASIDRLLQASTGLFPDVYEYNPNGNDSNRLEERVEKCIQMVNGEIPVYAVAFPRYSENSSGCRHFHTTPEFMRDQVQSSLDAVWTDANGKDHRVNGVAFWDAYVFVSMYTDNWSTMSNEDRKAYWDDVDALHVEFLSNMKGSVDAACDAAAARRALAEQEDNAVQVAADEAVAVAAAALEAERQQQEAQLLAQLNTAKVRLVRSKKSYRKRARSYRSSRKSWSKAKRAFAKAKRKFKKGSKQYKKALAQYKKSRTKSLRAARSFRKNRSSYRNARANWNTTKTQWQQANAGWDQMASSAQTLLACN
ncbi:MAG TPA: hypothetical protein EYO31_01720 [Phycisphaerales bacterium]|nr:hypothetical protein [Phycisphaerales bacterium]